MKKLIVIAALLTASLQVSAVIVVYGFEDSEGYTLGPLDGQNIWQSLSGIPDEPTISDSGPAQGLQHAQINRDPDVQAGIQSGALSPSLSFQPYDKSPSVSVDLYFSALNGAAYDMLAQSNSQNLITWRVRFTNTGDILIYDSPGGNNGFVDIGVQYPVGSYFKLYVETLTQLNEINYYIDEQLIYTAAAGVAFGQSIEQVVFISNNQHADDNEHMRFDNLVIDTENVDLIFADSFEASGK